MKKVLLGVCLLFACAFLNGCGGGETKRAVVADYNDIWTMKDVMIKNQRGLTFDYYCDNKSGMSAGRGTDKCRAVVKYIEPGSDAERAQIQVGDQVTMVNGESVEIGTIRNAFFSEDAKPITLTFHRGDKEYQTQLMPL